jgi:hypothetical protein
MKKSETSLYEISVEVTHFKTKRIRVPKVFENSKSLQKLLTHYVANNFSSDDFELIDEFFDDYSICFELFSEKLSHYDTTNDVLVPKCKPQELTEDNAEDVEVDFENWYAFEPEIELENT